MQDIRDLADRFHKFVTNDFHHLSVEVSYIKGQLKIVLMVMGILAVAVIGMLVQEVLVG
jgi:hypothetical protein